ncbi:MAG: hypothetical protein E6G57_11470 [Actinobacteria bacterium]|nr:MAG: hypothetical protein E6G57_11470 [Actinomycetota bacterium]
MRSARSILTDPRAVGVAQAAPRTAAFLAKSWATSRLPGAEANRPTLGLAAQVLLDEVLMAAMKNPRLFPSDDDYVRAGQDIAAAHEMWSERGWLDDPERYHHDPDVPMGCMMTRQRALNVGYEHLTFASRYEPHAGEPGRERWLSYEANRTAHAWVVRARAAGRPWLVCVHGWGMGSPLMDLRAFRSRRLSRELGLNLLVPVLPLHGPRQKPGANGGEGFMTIDLIDALHGFAQAAWDIRSAIRWIRFHDPDASVGIYGLSLGGYTAALTASLEDDLACVIAGIPATDIVDLYRRHSPPSAPRPSPSTASCRRSSSSPSPRPSAGSCSPASATACRRRVRPASCGSTGIAPGWRGIRVATSGSSSQVTSAASSRTPWPTPASSSRNQRRRCR